MMLGITFQGQELQLNLSLLTLMPCTVGIWEGVTEPP